MNAVLTKALNAVITKFKNEHPLASQQAAEAQARAWLAAHVEIPEMEARCLDGFETQIVMKGAIEVLIERNSTHLNREQWELLAPILSAAPEMLKALTLLVRQDDNRRRLERDLPNFIERLDDLIFNMQEVAFP